MQHSKKEVRLIDEEVIKNLQILDQLNLRQKEIEVLKLKGSRWPS